MRQVTPTNESCHTHEHPISTRTYYLQCARIAMSHVTHINESRDTYKRAMSHIWTSQVTHERVMSHKWTPTIASVFELQWVMSQEQMSHVTHMNESCHTSEHPRSRQCARVAMRQVTHINESCHTHEHPLSTRTYHFQCARIAMSHVTHMNHTCHTHKRVMSHIWTSHDAPLLRLMIDTCHTYSINESWHMYKKVISHISKVTSHMWMRHVTRAHAACHTYEWCMSFMWVVHITRVH